MPPSSKDRDTAVSEIEGFEEANNNNNNETKDPLDTLSRSRLARTFKEKTFQPRESMLTTLMSTTEMSVVYNFGAAIFVLFFLRALFDDIFNHGMPLHHTWLIWWNFEKFPQTMSVWFGLFIGSFVPYSGMKIWAHVPCKKVRLSNSWPMIVLFAGCLFAMFYFPLKFLFAAELNCACSFIITCETTRIAMKAYSFVRENVPRAVAIKESLAENEPPTTQWPTVEKFVYHQFCPSFIYRDEYPRTESTNWTKAAYHLIHCLMLIEYVNLVFTQWVQPWLSVLEYPSVSTAEITISLFAAIGPGLFCLICLFYGLLHSWLNMFSEVLRFADRHFYDNWWNSDNMAEYYRNWNLVVHDWLYAYIYKDLSVLIGGKIGKQVSQTAVFFLSSVFHEYWFGVAFRCFYPVMFLLYFVFGGVFFSVSRLIRNKYVWNTALWFNLLIGTGMFVAFYGQEWYARRGKCAPYESSIADIFLPRHWNCQPLPRS